MVVVVVDVLVIEMLNDGRQVRWSNFPLCWQRTRGKDDWGQGRALRRQYIQGCPTVLPFDVVVAAVLVLQCNAPGKFMMMWTSAM